MKGHKAVGVMIFDDKQNILLLRRSDVGTAPKKLGLVGGYIEEGESSAIAAVREVVEETGIELIENQLVPFKEYAWEVNGESLLFTVFTYKLVERPSAITLQLDENTEYLWLAPSDAIVRGDLMQNLYTILKDYVV